MKVMNQSAIRLLIVWLLVVPPGIFYLAFTNLPQVVNWPTMIVFIVFGFLTILFRIKRNGMSVILIMWVTVPAFLLYGLFIEIIIMQVSMLAIFFTSSDANRVARFFLNSILFFMLSVVSAAVFHIFGGVIGSIEFWPILFATFCYQFVYTTLNYFTGRLTIANQKLKSILFTDSLFLAYGKIFVLFLFSLMIYFLYQYIGLGALLLLGVPYFFVVLMIRLNSDAEQVNSDLQHAGLIGHEISGKLTVDKVLDQFVLKVSETFNAEYAYLFDHEPGRLELIRSYEKTRFIDVDFNPLLAGQGIAGTALLKKEPIIYSKREEWRDVSKDYTPDDMQSILCVPIVRNQKIEGVLLLASTRKSAFKDYQLTILDLLCSYFTVSVEKARYLQNIIVESNRCALTKLYNYRYLDERLTSAMERVNNGFLDELSVVMLDIDHFKKVNDTYGHQSGNDILCMFAKKLEEKLPKGSVVTRYGGEEFVYLLRGYGKKEALVFAEELRLEIERMVFPVTSDLATDQSTVPVKITTSIGVSTAPEDASDAQSILRGADRSLYLLAKQAGRNRVAGYVR